MESSPYRKDVLINVKLRVTMRIDDSFLLIFHSQKSKGARNLRNPVLFRKHTPDIGVGDVVDWIE